MPTPFPTPFPTPAPTPTTSFAPPLTPSNAPPVESAPQDRCETPQQRQKRRDDKRDACTKFVKIKVRAHTKRLCVSDLVEHESRKLARKGKRLVKSAIRKELVKLGVPKLIAGALTGKRRRRLRLPTVKIPGTEIGVDLNPFLPKAHRPTYERPPRSS